MANLWLIVWFMEFILDSGLHKREMQPKGLEQTICVLCRTVRF